jgi:hypothetical protein
VYTQREIAAQEGVDNSYVSRMMNLTVLSPDIVEAILDDALPDHLTLFDIAVDPPALWERQRAWLGLALIASSETGIAHMEISF